MTYIQISLGEYRSFRNLGWRFERIKWEEPRSEGHWYPDWTLYLGPVIVRRLRFTQYRNAQA